MKMNTVSSRKHFKGSEIHASNIVEWIISATKNLNRTEIILGGLYPNPSINETPARENYSHPQVKKYT